MKGIKTRQENELLENNQLIAEFMKVQVRTYTHGGTSYNPDKCWELLMRVVKRIYRLGLDNESTLLVRDAVAEANRKDAYQAVVEFIKWYNENKED